MIKGNGVFAQVSYHHSLSLMAVTPTTVTELVIPAEVDGLSVGWLEDYALRDCQALE